MKFLTKQFVQSSLSLLILAILLGVRLWLPEVALAAGPIVVSSPPGDYPCTATGFSSAISSVNSGGTVSFTDNCTINLTTPLTLTKNITIDGTGYKVVIDGQNLYRIFNVNADFTMKGLTLQNGNAGASDGGAITLSGSRAKIENSTIMNNTALRGGGIKADSNSSLEIINSTLSGNTSTQTGWNHSGGAIAVGFQTTVFITNATIYNNISNSDNGGAAIYRINGAPSIVYIANSIIGRNTAPKQPIHCAGGGFTSNGYNWNDNTIQTDCAIGTGTGDTVGAINGNIDGTLALNGGTTATYALLSSSSSALDKIDFANCPATDQRGKARLDIPGVGSGYCDIGAYEFQPPTLSINANASATEGSAVTFNVTLSAAIPQLVMATYILTGGTATSGTDFNGTSGIVPVPANSTSGSFTVNTMSDSFYEGNETFTVSLTTPTTWTLINTTQYIGTIIDDDSPPSISISDTTVMENAGSGSMNFTVTLSAAAGVPVTVIYAMADGTAKAGTDYTPSSGMVTFLAGETSQFINVPVNNNALSDGDRTFNVNLSGASNATISKNTASGTILDDELPQVSIEAVTTGASEGNSGNTPFTFKVKLNKTSPTLVTVQFLVEDGTARLDDSDYEIPSPSSVTIPANTLENTFVVNAKGDTKREDDETFSVKLTGVSSNASISTDVSKFRATATIRNDDATPDLSIYPSSAMEGNSGTTAMTFIIDLTGISPQNVTVQYKTIDNTAKAGLDFTYTNGTATIPAGKTYTTISIPIMGDTLVENNETFTVQLRNPSLNATLPTTKSQVVGTIYDDDTPGIFINDVVKNEGNTGETAFVFQATLSPASSQPITISYQTIDGTATASGGDIVATSGILVFKNETTKYITVPVKGDGIYEDNETFFVKLFNPQPSNLLLIRPQGQANIINDDLPVSINLKGATEVMEGLSANFELTLSAPVTTAVTVDYTTADGTAIAGSDYRLLSGTVTFNPGITRQVVSVQTIKNPIYNPTTTFFFKLTSSFNGLIEPPGQAKTTIIDTTGQPSISINNVTVTEGENVLTVFKVSLTAPSVQTVTVDYETADGPMQEGQAQAGLDYYSAIGSLSFPPAVTSQLITVTVLEDTENEPNEAFYVNLNNPVNVALGVSQGIGTIKDNNDPLPQLAIDNVSIVEGDSGSPTVIFKITLTPASGKTVSVNYTTTDGTAKAGTDYIGKSGVLTFTPGTTELPLSVSIKGDITAELDETFSVNLRSGVNAIIATAQGMGTIVNDDIVTISAADNSIVQTANPQALTFEVTLSVPCDRVVTVDYATANGSATAKRDDLPSSVADYVAITGTLTFTPGVTKQTISVTVLGDLRYELEENFFVNLSRPTNSTIGLEQATGTIINHNTPSPYLPMISINDVAVAEGDSDLTKVVFTVLLTRPIDFTEPVTLNYVTADGTSSSLPELHGSPDYHAISGTLTFGTGITRQHITVYGVGDRVAEEDEDFFVNLFNSSQAIIAKEQGTGVILNDDVSAISVNDVMVKEGLQNVVVFTVTLSVPNERLVSVEYSTSNGTAQMGVNYLPQNSILVFPPGVTALPITVPILNNSTAQKSQIFYLNLNNPFRAVITTSATSNLTGTGQAVILEDDGLPTFYLQPQVTAIKESSTSYAAFNVSLWPSSSFPVQVNYETFDDTASAGLDYQAMTGTLVFAPGVTEQTINVPIIGGQAAGPAKKFWLKLLKPIQAAMSNDVGQAMILSNGVAEVSITPQVTIWEGTTPEQFAVFSVTLSMPSSQVITVNYETADETAKAGQNYVATSGQVTFPPGSVVQTIRVLVVDDLVATDTQTFLVQLSQASNATLKNSAGQAIIFDGNGAPKLYINDAVVDVRTTRTAKALFTVKIWPLAKTLVSVDYTTFDGTAKAGVDYVSISDTLTFFPGDQSQPLAIVVQNGSQVESNLYFVVKLSGAVGADIGYEQGIGTIIGQTLPTTMTINDVTVKEGQPAQFMVTLSRPVTQTVIVNYATADGTAVAGQEYTATQGSLSFSPGTTAQTVTVATINQAAVAPTKTFLVNLTQTSFGQMSDGQGIGTILDEGLSPVPTLSISNTEVIEQDTNFASAMFDVQLSFSSSLTVTVKYGTADGTAMGGQDYLEANGLLTFPPNSLTQTVMVPVWGDTRVEGNETFVLNLTAPTNAVLGNSPATCTIIDNDVKPIEKIYLPLIIK